MARVTELRIRSDWGFVKFAYLPALAGGGVLAFKFLVPIVAISIRVAPCGICVLFSRWGNHFEEWLNCKPLLKITETGLLHEDGGEAVEYPWSDIVGIVMHRRNRIPPWRTNGGVSVTPPYWLAISVRGDPQIKGSDEGYLDRSRYLPHYSRGAGDLMTAEATKIHGDDVGFSTEGYLDRSRYLGPEPAAVGDDIETICIWPRQVVGGLFSLMRFAKELQRRLIDESNRGEIPSLLPSKG